jgi:hypothetical protein
LIYACYCLSSILCWYFNHYWVFSYKQTEQDKIFPVEEKTSMHNRGKKYVRAYESLSLCNTFWSQSGWFLPTKNQEV